MSDFGQRHRSWIFGINRNTLIDQLIQHESGVKLRKIEYFELDETVFQAVPEGPLDAMEDDGEVDQG